MNRTGKLAALLLLTVLLFSLFGCTQGPDTVTEPPSTQPPIDAAAIYTQAIADLQDATALQLHTQTGNAVTVGKELFYWLEDVSLTLQGLGTQELAAQTSLTLDYGSYLIEVQEIYANGNLYSDFGDDRFTSSMSAEEFTARYTPAILLDPTLYTDLQAVEDNGTVTITFTGATAAEKWLQTEGLSLIAAAGTAVVEDGKLTRSSYTAKYTLGSISRTVSVRQTVLPEPQQTVTAPMAIADYKPLTFHDGPMLMEQAFGLMLQAETVTSTIQESTYCQAAGFLKTAQTDINTYWNEKDPMARVKQTITQLNYAAGATADTEQLEELFRQGKYSMSANGGDYRENDAVLADTMQEYYLNTLTENLLELCYLRDATCTDLGSALLVEFTCDSTLAEAYRKELNYELFRDEAYLDKMSSGYKTADTCFYLAIDRYSGLPTALGIRYEVQHTINGVPYELSTQTDQSLDLASLSSYRAITDSAAPDGPAPSPTPLFYRVTGPNGQELWLFGTIHIGDDRTAYLPAQITEALKSSDALAIECDVNGFEEALKSDAKLQEQVSQAYYDSTTQVESLLEEPLYSKALAWMKVSGNHSTGIDSLRPAFWSQSIENFYLRQGGQLSADKGVENRLMDLANAAGIPLWEVESVISQLQMQAGWSQPLQKLLLEGSLQTDPISYAEEANQLYALWCQGDAQALTQALKTDTSSMTDAELALYKEYTKGMETDRNAQMLKVAKEYLQSGDTVFFAVGLAHVLAEDGLVNGLRAAGYTVEQVTY